ncbi:MAG: GNAT family N-acetyltransferase [Bacteroidota bacterium]
MNIKTEKLNNRDTGKFTELIRVFEDVFKMNNFKMPDEIYLQGLLDKNDFFVFVALQDNKVIGGLTSYIMQQYYSKSPLVYIYDLAVKTEFQRQGIGKMLIAANNNFCRGIGVEAVMVEADEVDDYAIEFYQKTGAKGEKVIHFDYLLNENV